MKRRRVGYLQSKHLKREISKRLSKVRIEASGYSGQCLFPSEDNEGLCVRPPSRCHVIPRRAVLDKLKDQKSGKVLEFDWEVEQWSYLLLSSSTAQPVDLADPATFRPRDVGTRDACKGPFACQPHDGVFNPELDTDNPDFGNADVRRLAMGRAVLHATDLANRRKYFVDNLVDNRIVRSVETHDKALYMRWLRAKKFAYTTQQAAHSVAERWRCMWRYADRKDDSSEDLVDWCTLTFRSTLAFAACVFYGKATVVMTFPGDSERHKMTLLSFREDFEKVQEDKEQLTRSASDSDEVDSYRVSVIKALMTRGNGVFAASPASYEALPMEDRLAIQCTFMEKLQFWTDFAQA